jgi:hypothetical protein
MASEQQKQPRKWPPYDEGARIISYNVNEDGRPFGVKIRFKIRIVTGKRSHRPGQAAGRRDQGVPAIGQAVPAIPEFRARGHARRDAGSAPVGVAFLGRTSTSTMQDPVVSLLRQYRQASDRLPEGFCITLPPLPPATAQMHA